MPRFERLFDVLHWQLQEGNITDALCEKVDGEWKHYSTKYSIERVNQLSRALWGMGFRPGDKIAMIAGNSPQWNWLDLGMMQIGVVNVPMYTTLSPDDYRYILLHSGARMVIAGDRQLYHKIAPLREHLPHLEHLIAIKPFDDALSLDFLLSHDKSELQPEVDRLGNGIKGDEVCTIIYTSGTTGAPKGVMLSHRNIISNIESTLEVVPIKRGMSVISVLPICHIFERMACYLFMTIGASVYYGEGLEKIGENIREVRPHFFTTVPRLLEKVYEKIVNKGKELTGIKKKLFFAALKMAENYDPERRPSLPHRLKMALFDKLIFSKWRAALGGRVVAIVSGAAALQPRLAASFSAAGIPVREGYGQTEASPVISVNGFGPGEMRLGTVGMVIPGVTVKIAEDGEILVKGPNVMAGYYQREDLTREALDADGWLHTGDVGTWVDGKFLKITDRKKELFKNSGGKYISPQTIENKFRESFYIEQIMVVGENRKSVAALIVPNEDNVRSWCEENGVSCPTFQDMASSPEVQKLFGSIRNQFNEQLGEAEKVKRFALIADKWGVETGEMTATLKLRRKTIQEKYAGEIANLYRNED